jgi:hypothetical protein
MLLDKEFSHFVVRIPQITSVPGKMELSLILLRFSAAYAFALQIHVGQSCQSEYVHACERVRILILHDVIAYRAIINQAVASALNHILIARDALRTPSADITTLAVLLFGPSGSIDALGKDVFVRF